MREIKSGDIVLRIRASSLTIYFYKQEFKADILKAFGQLCKGWLENGALEKYAGGVNLEEIPQAEAAALLDVLPDGNEFLQIVWALNKAQNVAETLPTPHFEEWLGKYGELSVLDVMAGVIEECIHGFFRVTPAPRSGG
jgi:hypothetical protein